MERFKNQRRARYFLVCPTCPKRALSGQNGLGTFGHVHHLFQPHTRILNRVSPEIENNVPKRAHVPKRAQTPKRVVADMRKEFVKEITVTAYIKRLKAPHPVQGLADDPDRVCLVCHDPIPYARGIAHPHLRALAHQGACAQILTEMERGPGKTARGRWRRPSQVFALANGVRCAQCLDV